jgi:hypothetical protein
MKTYVQHEEALKSFDYDTALLYSKAFNIDIDLLNINKVKK